MARDGSSCFPKAGARAGEFQFRQVFPLMLHSSLARLGYRPEWTFGRAFCTRFDQSSREQPLGGSAVIESLTVRHRAYWRGTIEAEACTMETCKSLAVPECHHRPSLRDWFPNQKLLHEGGTDVTCEDARSTTVSDVWMFGSKIMRRRTSMPAEPYSPR